MINKKYIALIIILLFSLFCFGSPVTAQNDDGVLTVLKKYDNAWNSKDKATVAKILAPKYIYFSSTGGTTTRERTLEFLASPDYKLTFVERTEVASYRTGDTAVISSRWKGKGVYEKGEINDDQRCSLVFTKVKGSWKLASEHCTQIVSK